MRSALSDAQVLEYCSRALFSMYLSPRSSRTDIHAITRTTIVTAHNAYPLKVRTSSELQEWTASPQTWALTVLKTSTSTLSGAKYIRDTATPSHLRDRSRPLCAGRPERVSAETSTRVATQAASLRFRGSGQSTASRHQAKTSSSPPTADANIPADIALFTPNRARPRMVRDTSPQIRIKAVIPS
jgi:hypothetical protein